MREKYSIEAESASKPELNIIAEQYQRELADPLLSRIKTEIEGTDKSNPAYEEVLVKFEEFLKSLRIYFDSYNGLKATARKERQFFHSDPEKYREGILNADKREKILHDNFISSANILSRTMKKAGLSNEWRGDASIYVEGGKNDSEDKPARDKFREWMFRIYHETFNS